MQASDSQSTLSSASSSTLSSPKSQPRSPSNRATSRSQSSRKAIKIVGISGSIRQGSICKQALELALDSCGKTIQTSIIDLETLNLPFRDGLDFQGERYEKEKATIDKLRKRVSEASGLIIATPEYHNSYSGVLKNALDWLTGQELKGKIVGLISVSAGDQGNQAIPHLRDVFRAFGSWVISEQAAVPTAHRYFGASGCQDDTIATRIRTVGQSTAKLAVLYAKEQSRNSTFLGAMEASSQKKNVAAAAPEVARKKLTTPPKNNSTSQIEDITEKIFQLPKVQDKLIVIGGGFAGLRIGMNARTKYQVLMIDSKDYWEYTPSVPRCLVQPERAKTLIVPHDRNMKDHFFRGLVTSIHSDHIVVDQKYRIPFNYLVIAAGSRYPSVFGGNAFKRVTRSVKEEQGTGGNFKDQYTDHQTRIQAIQTESARAKAATTICVIGGGPVGVELLGELAMRYPTKKLVLIHSHKKLLNNVPAQEAAGKLALNFFAGFSNIQLLLGHRVIKSAWKDGKWTIGTDTQQIIVAEKVYFCAGLIPNSEMMRTAYTNTLDARGFIQVNSNLQVKGTTNIYAVGDIVSGVNDLKTAYAAGEQAKHIVANLNKLKEGKVKTYKPLGYQPNLMALSLGPFRGIFIWHGKIASTKAMACNVKNKFEVAVCVDLGQDKAVFKHDLNKALKAEIRSQKNVVDIGGDDEEDAATEDLTCVTALFGTPEASSGDVFH